MVLGNWLYSITPQETRQSQQENIAIYGLLIDKLFVKQSKKLSLGNTAKTEDVSKEYGFL